MGKHEGLFIETNFLKEGSLSGQANQVGNAPYLKRNGLISEISYFLASQFAIVNLLKADAYKIGVTDIIGG